MRQIIVSEKHNKMIPAISSKGCLREETSTVPHQNLLLTEGMAIQLICKIKS